MIHGAVVISQGKSIGFSKFYAYGRIGYANLGPDQFRFFSNYWLLMWGFPSALTFQEPTRKDEVTLKKI